MYRYIYICLLKGTVIEIEKALINDRLRAYTENFAFHYL